MSLIIKGMKLPLPGNMMVCALIDGKLQCSIVTRDKPIEWCEVLEIPTPHGRLIDAGALANKYERFHRILKGSNLMADKVRRDEIDMFLSELKCNAPTIIEAEVE